MYQVLELVTLDSLLTFPPHMIFYGANHLWWTSNPKDLRETDPVIKDGRTIVPGGIPCDPLGGVLFQTQNVSNWLDKAKEKPEHFGKHGLRAFMLAHHGNLTWKGRDWCFKTWDEYNRVLDGWDRTAQLLNRLPKKQ